MNPLLLPKCICGSDAWTATEINGIPVMHCRCGIERALVKTNRDFHAAWCAEYHRNQIYQHSYDQDAAVAEKRIDAHGAFLAGRILDVGSGNEAFVRTARKHGFDAWGQDIAVADGTEFTYIGPLKSIGFPTGWADTITMHDVLEHVVDPNETLSEAHRIIKPGGSIIIDFPDFHAEAGVHHWKPWEHLWFFRPDAFVSLVRSHGFQVSRVDTPIPGKIVVYAERLPVFEPSILVPAGIGDIHWIMTKMRGFLKDHDLGLPAVWIDSPDDKRRSLDFVRSIPFVRAAGYHDGYSYPEPSTRYSDIYGRMSRIEGFRRDARHAFLGVDGFDWFLSWNGSITEGRALEDTEHETDWDIPMFLSLPDRHYGEDLRRRIGPYIAAAFFSARFYRHWIADMPASEIYDLLAGLADATGMKIIMTGAEWDRNSGVNIELMKLDAPYGRLVSLIGETTLGQYFGMLRAASGCVGFPAGNTMIAPAFGVPTVLLWNDYFPRAMWKNAVAPSPIYKPVKAGDKAALRVMLDLLRKM